MMSGFVDTCKMEEALQVGHNAVDAFVKWYT